MLKLGILVVATAAIVAFEPVVAGSAAAAFVAYVASFVVAAAAIAWVNT